MEMQNIENTLKKMGLVLEKVVKKVDELDKRVAKLEEKLGENEKKFSSADLKATPQTQTKTSTSSSFGSGFGSSFLGSMAGAVAGMGLYNLLFNHSVSPAEFGYKLGMNDTEINEAIESNFDEIDSKLDEIDAKIDELDSKIDNFEDNDVMSSDYFENYDEEDIGNDFESDFDDLDGFEDI